MFARSCSILHHHALLLYGCIKAEDHLLVDNTDIVTWPSIQTPNQKEYNHSGPQIARHPPHTPSAAIDPLKSTAAPSLMNMASTNSAETESLLFSPHLISPEVAASLPEGYTIRPLRRSDYNGGKHAALT
jgi:hypothetical protein